MNTNVRDLNLALLSLMECTACKKYMIPPIRQCADGHNQCSTCVSILANCSACGQNFIKARNFALEEIARKLDFPCEFRNKGCMATFKVENLDLHQKNCLYNMHRCRVGSCKVWSSQLPILVDHVKEMHADSILVGSVKEMKITKWESTANHWFVYLMLSLDEYVWLHYKLMGKYNKLMVAVQKLGTGNSRYEVVMGSADSNLITYSAATHPEDKEMNEVFTAEDCFCISTRAAKNFITLGKTLKFNVSIKSV